MKPFFLAALAAFLLSIPSHASWGTSGCEPVGSFETPQYKWYKYAPGEFTLWYGDRQIGALRAKGRAFFALLPDRSWIAATCPCELPKGVCRCPNGCSCPPDECQCDPDNCPCQKNKVTADVPPGGVDRDKVEASKGKHIHNGKEVSKEAVLDAIKRASVPSDQTKLRLTLIGQKDATDAILGDLKSIPEVSDVLIAAYTPDHWAVAGPQGLSGGKPFSIVLQSPDGKVLHRQWDYDGGAEKLAEALRDARTDYDPAKDPDRRHIDPLASLLDRLKAIPVELWLIGAVVAFLLFRKKD